MEKATFDGHQLWSSLDQLKTLLDQLDDRDISASGASLPQMRYVLAQVQSHRDPADATPYSAAGVNAVQSQLASAAGEVNNFLSNTNQGHVTNASNNVDQALNMLGSWPSQTLRGGAAAQANKAFAEYRKEAEEAATTLREANAELQQRLAEAAANHSSEIADLKAQVTALTTKISADEGRLDTALTTNNEAFNAKQTEREEKFATFVKEQGAGLKTLADTDLVSIKLTLEQAQAHYDEIDQLREDTEKVAGLASADLLAGKYSEYATQQWRWGLGASGLGFAALAVGLALLLFALKGIAPDAKVSWAYTTLKLGASLTVVAASAVAFRLGRTFLQRSSTSKQTELELRAIGPFFADIDDAEAVKDAKKSFVARSFGQHNNLATPTVAIPGTTDDLLKALQPVIDLAKTAATHPST